MEVLPRSANRVVFIGCSSVQNHLIESVITQLGYVPHIVGVDCNSLKSVENIAAVVVCHQTSRYAPLPSVPRRRGCERVIVLSDLQTEHAIVTTLERGAHHYFNLNEPPLLLEARLKAALRRHRLEDRRVFECSPYTFHVASRTVERDGETIKLNPKEFDCAYYLFQHQNRIVKTEELLVSVWSLPAGMDARRIDTAASRLRKKLSLDADGTGWELRRVYKTGYRLIKTESNYSRAGSGVFA